MQRSDKDPNEVSRAPTSFGIGAQGDRGSSATEQGPKPVPYRGSDGRDDVQHGLPEGTRGPEGRAPEAQRPSDEPGSDPGVGRGR
jgi:hypothetical protein